LENSDNVVALSNEQEQAIRQIIAGAGGAFDYDTVVAGLTQHGWRIHPVHSNGVIAGGIIQKHAELHTSIAPEFQRKWNPRPYINDILYAAFEQYGEVTSLSPKEDVRCLKWLKKLGFAVVREDECYFYLRLAEIKFKPAPC
jgi:hypothetical protein